MGCLWDRFCLQILTDLVKLFFAVPRVILVVRSQVFIILVKIEIVSWPGQNLPPRHHLDTVMTTNLTSPIFWKGLSCNNDDSVSLAHVFLTAKTGVLLPDTSYLKLSLSTRPVVYYSYRICHSRQSQQIQNAHFIHFIVISTSYGSTPLSPTLRVASIMRPHIINSILF